MHSTTDRPVRQRPDECLSHSGCLDGVQKCAFLARSWSRVGSPPGAERPKGASMSATAKAVLTDDRPLRLDIPSDRDEGFAPILIPKCERRFTGFADKIITMYARDTTVREIRAFLSEQYVTDASHDFIRSVTDAV